MSERTSWEEQERRIEESIQLRDNLHRQHAEFFESYRCVVCDEPGGTYCLWGGRKVALCNAHTNAWNEYVLVHPLWLEKAELEAKYDVAVYGGDEYAALHAKRRIVELQVECYELSGKWLGAAMEQHDIGNGD